jgi:hypothetical protein
MVVRPRVGREHARNDRCTVGGHLTRGKDEPTRVWRMISIGRPAGVSRIARKMLSASSMSMYRRSPAPET